MSEASEIITHSCHDSRRIEKLLAADFYDSPVCFFPSRLVRAAAAWLANNDGVHIVVAESNGEHAGYVFAHTFGPTLWRVFARHRPLLLPLFGYVLWKQRMPTRGPVERFAHARPQSAAGKVSQLDLPKENIPFRWSSPDSHTAYIEMVQVADRFRGQGIATLLLRAVMELMSRDRVLRAEAHIDPANYASVRAFLNADWRVVRTSTMDFKASWAVESSSQ